MACIRKRRGKWVIDFYDQMGRRRWETVGVSKKEAERVLRDRLAQVDRGTFRPRKQVPTFKEIAQDWLDNQVAHTVRPTTAFLYRGYVKNHLEPFFGSVRVSLITPRTIERYIKNRLDAGTGRVLINKTLIALGMALKYAVRHRLIDHNPARDVEKLKRNGEPKEEMGFLTPEEIRLLLEHSEARYRPLFLTAVLTGMRQGELLGLTWEDIDWNNQQVHVSRTYNHGQLFSPKSQASRRKIDMAPELVSALKRWKLACPKGPQNLVFPNTEGGFSDAGNMVERGFLPALRRAGLRKVRFHDLRHTYAALLIKQGEHPKYIQAQMGHSSINVTMDTYGHLMDAVNQQAAAKLGSLVFGESGSKMVAAATLQARMPELSN